MAHFILEDYGRPEKGVSPYPLQNRVSRWGGVKEGGGHGIPSSSQARWIALILSRDWPDGLLFPESLSFELQLSGSSCVRFVVTVFCLDYMISQNLSFALWKCIKVDWLIFERPIIPWFFWNTVFWRVPNKDSLIFFGGGHLYTLIC